MLKLEDWMNKKVKTAKEQDTVMSAAKAMVKSDMGALVVVDAKKQPIGIVTESDIVRRLLVRGYDPKTATVGEIMTKHVVTIDVDSTVIALSQAMQKNNIRKMPVIKKGKLVGIITARDMIRIMSGI